MNNMRRKKIVQAKMQIEQIINRLGEIRDNIEDIQIDESDAYDNLPENLQDSDRGCNMDEAIDSMDEAMGSIDEAIDKLNESISNLDEIN